MKLKGCGGREYYGNKGFDFVLSLHILNFPNHIIHCSFFCPKQKYINLIYVKNTTPFSQLTMTLHIDDIHLICILSYAHLRLLYIQLSFSILHTKNNKSQKRNLIMKLLLCSNLSYVRLH